MNSHFNSIFFKNVGLFFEVVYFHRNSWYPFTEMTGTLSPKQLVPFARNGWYTFTESTGTLCPKRVVYF